jgi:type III secretion protein V
MTLTDRITRALVLVSGRGDLAIATLVLVAVVMMIVPLPTLLVDLLITSNIATSVLILLVAFYISEPVQLSSLPTIVLLATLFRLAITISTARLILLQADAGEIINTFGTFVVGGNIAVGLVVFVIITVAQFVVITKGAERVAEVAARFSLDAMPGKQMSIDNDLRSGDIDQAEARRLRRRLGQESHLYGAMDGAMKFVKGDSIASLIVILVNLIGGLAIGSLQRGLSLSSAVETYSLLTVGDGLVAQIPALLVSVAAGIVVTRVSAAEQFDLGTEISKQLFNDPRALYLGALILLGLGFIPGFPWPAFVTLAAIFAAGGYWSRWKKMAAARLPAGTTPMLPSKSEAGRSALPQPQPPVSGEAGRSALPHPPVSGAPDRVAVYFGPGLAQRVPPVSFREQCGRLRAALAADIGVELPPVKLSLEHSLPPDNFLIEFDSVPVAQAEIPAERLVVEAEAVDLELLGAPFTSGPSAVGPRAMWVEERHRGALAAAGIEALGPADVLAKWLSRTVRRYAAQLIGIQETRGILALAEKEFPELVKEAQKIATLQKMAEILRRLVEENVPISNMRLILEAVVEWGPREQDTILLVEYVRIALRRQICFRCADRNRIIVAYMLERAAEETLRSSVRSTAVGAFLSVAESAARPIVDRVRTAFAAAPDTVPVLLTSMDVRRHVRSLLVRNDLDVTVLSYQELAPEFSVQPLAALANKPEQVRIGVAAASAV